MSKLSDKFKDFSKPHPPIAPKPIQKQDLKPPKPPKPPTKPAPEEDQEFFIDFNKIANNSSFQRFIVEAIKMSVPQLKGINARTSKNIMSKAFNEKITEIDQAVVLYNEFKGLDNKQLQEIRSHPLFLSQQKLNNSK